MRYRETRQKEREGCTQTIQTKKKTNRKIDTDNMHVQSHQNVFQKGRTSSSIITGCSHVVHQTKG